MEFTTSIIFLAILREGPIAHQVVQTILKSVGKWKSYRDFKTSVLIFHF